MPSRKDAEAQRNGAPVPCFLRLCDSAS